MVEYKKIDDESIDRLMLLANEVSQKLQLAGFIAQVFAGAEFDLDFVGMKIEVDTGDNAAGGVWVDWCSSRELRGLAAESVRNHVFDSRDIIHSGTVSEAMQRAIFAILYSAGFAVENSDEDMRPFEVRVIAATR